MRPSPRFYRSAWLLAGLLAAPAAKAQAEPAPEPEPPRTGAIPGGSSGAVPVAPKPEPPPQPVTPPRIVHFENAPYPTDAEKAGIEANVILRLDIDKDGKVTSVAVAEPAGHGFDEAAARAAAKFTFEPAKRGDTPIAARILYRYSFTLTPTPAATAPAPPEHVDALGGIVRVAGSDTPLPGASVRVHGDHGEDLVVSTGDDGTWKAQDLEPGRYTITVSAAGFNDVTQEEDVAKGTATEVVYRLAPKSDALEVTVQGTRPPREVTRRTIEQREINRIPGTSGDALRSLQNLPGVARPPAFSGLLIVRGSAPQDSMTFIDGVYVPIVYHFGGLSSVVPTEMLEKIDFYPGNFSAQYGRVMGGIVDVGLRSPKNDGKYHGLAQVDLIDGRLLLEGPIPVLKGWNFIVGARRSWVDLWLKPVLTQTGAGVTTAPVYYDYQGFIETKPTARSSFRIGAMGTDDRLELLIKDPAQQDPAFGGNIGFHTGFFRLNAIYRNEISDQLRFSTVASYGTDTVDFSVGTLFFRVFEKIYQQRSEIAYHPVNWLTLHGGIEIAYIPYDVDLRLPAPPAPGEPDPGPYAAKPPLSLSTHDYGWSPAAYLEAEVTPTNRARIVPGLRVDYMRATERYDVAPRINGRYDIVHDFPRTTVKGGVGLFYQGPQPQEYVAVFGSPGLRSNRAIHYSVGVEQDITRPVEVSVEGFYKSLDQLVSRVPNDIGSYDYKNEGSGYVVGAEVLLKYKPDSRFFGWLAYTLSRATRRDHPNAPEQLFQWDQTHILTVLGSYRLGHGWEFGARMRLVSGSLYTPFVGGIYSADAGTYAGISGTPYSARFPMFHQLDLRVDKEWRYRHWNLRMYLDVQNAYNRANPEEVTYNYNYSQKQVVGFLPIIPSLGLRGDF